MTRLQLTVLLLLLLGLVLFTAGRLRPLSAGQPTACEHPIGVSRNAAQFVFCAPAASIAARQLLAQVGSPACAEQVSPRARLRAGEQLVLYPGCKVATGRLAGTARLTLGLRVELNRASQADLCALPRIGPVLAERIVRDREQQGPYQRLGQLRRVRGIGPATLRRIAPLVTVNP